MMHIYLFIYYLFSYLLTSFIYLVVSVIGLPHFNDVIMLFASFMCYTNFITGI